MKKPYKILLMLVVLFCLIAASIKINEAVTFHEHYVQISNGIIHYETEQIVQALRDSLDSGEVRTESIRDIVQSANKLNSKMSELGPYIDLRTTDTFKEYEYKFSHIKHDFLRVQNSERLTDGSYSLNNDQESKEDFKHVLNDFEKLLAISDKYGDYDTIEAYYNEVGEMSTTTIRHLKWNFK
ncbi:hypothetical protein N780_05805 [Pontibacillus chungwhensis BH030062]|uniref:Uncharacterized protein n=1 Tax=Pontibacillus chungwhensis BH030062 TaxID=1385513 RepID=A0A0A2V9B6_9BACI|nr:hypothetical protein [Pontibacillus chungwhensis]KGP90290.1 hypothetical protein N780_05805 [Pontibacillus chungwhensis BH030062]